MVSDYNCEDKQKLLKNGEFSHFILSENEKNCYDVSKTAHELRNRMTLIVSSLQLLEQHQPEVREFKYWTYLMDDLNATKSLLFDLSRGKEEGRLNKQVSDLFEVTNDILESFAGEFLKSGITVDCMMEKEAKPYTREYPFDVLRIQQVIVNMIKNAIEACHEGDCITVSFSLQEHEKFHYKKALKLSICNSGDPMDEKERDLLFMPYYSTKDEGTGLGLPVSRDIIQQHGGDIQVISTKEMTEFAIFLPLQHDEQNPEEGS